MAGMRILSVLVLGAFLTGCASGPERRGAEGRPAEAGGRGVLRPGKLAEMDAVIAGSISSNQLPGGVLWFEREGTVYRKAYGNRAEVPAVEAMTEDTIFDAASLTKVIATTPSIMLLVERGKMKLDEPAATYWPEFGKNGKEGITVRHLMTHTSGLRPGIPGRPAWEGYEKGMELAAAERPAAEPGTRFRYSDINFIVLGELVRRVSGRPLDEFAEREVFGPLGMKDTEFQPSALKLPRIAPTEKRGDTVLRGVVHDPTSRRMGGVAGHAGLFTTARDLARFARMMLGEGTLEGRRLFQPETVRLMTTVQSPEEVRSRRGLGWDIDSPYASPRGEHLPIGSYGHTGWTGTSIWIDPFSDTFIIFLSNRNHPDESGSVVRLRRRLGTLAAEAVRDFNYVYVPGELEPAPEPEPKKRAARRVLNGIDVLKRDRFAPLRGLKVGLITNHTGTDRERNPTIDLLHEAEGVDLAALFSPEHGIRGVLDAKVGDSRDEKTGLPIYSLYGERRIPSPEQLEGLDALVFDIQDIGCRFYTYISTMGKAMEAAASAGKKFFVLDRVNPINGVDIQGPVLKGERSFVGWHEIPVRHGMTVGELARMFNEEREIGVDLTVVPVEGWEREMYFDETALPWINPSPNMRSLTEALLYPGIGLLETTRLSVGRGTDRPFEVIGAPYIDDSRLAWELNQLELEGLRFVPIRFTPDASVFKGEECRGVNIILMDRDIDIVESGIAIAVKLQELYPDEFGLERYNRLLVHEPTLEAIREGTSAEAIKTSWQAELNDFRARRAEFLIYK